MGCADSQLAKVFKEEKAAKKAAKEAKKVKKEQKKLQEKIDKANEKKNFKKLRKLEKEMEQLKNEAAINGTILSQDSTSSTKSAEEDPYRFMTPAQKKQALIEEQKNLDKVLRGESLTHHQKVAQMNDKLANFISDGDIPKCQENLKCKYVEGYLNNTNKYL